MTRKEFIERIIDDITEGGIIPASPRIPRISSIIDNALNYFYENDNNSHEYQYLMISKTAFQTRLFKEKRQIELPKEVHAIVRYTTLHKQFRYDYGNNPDFQQTNWNFNLAISGDSTSMITAVGVNSYNAFLEKFIINDIQYEFSSFSHMLTVKGRNSVDDTVAEITVKCPESTMFENERFFRYCTGKCKMSFANTIGFINQKLIGGYAIDINSIKSDGKSIVDEVLKEIAEERVGDFMTFFD